jgi:uncharacterized membrane protein YoaK (UPF0700 family)
MKTKNHLLRMDERNKWIAFRIIAVMYFITITAIQGIVIYRQFVMQQSIYEFEDIAVILTFNSLFLISALLYFGAIPIQKLKIKSILLIYLAIVILGSLFTYAKYNVFQDAGLTIEQLLDKLVIIFSVSGLIMLFFVIFSILGKRKIDKQIES